MTAARSPRRTRRQDSPAPPPILACSPAGREPRPRLSPLFYGGEFNHRRTHQPEYERRTLDYTADEFLERQTGLRRSVVEALARSERGYTQSAIARGMETSEGTVGSWYDRVAVEFGLPALHPLYKDQYENPRTLSP